MILFLLYLAKTVLHDFSMDNCQNDYSSSLSQDPTTSPFTITTLEKSIGVCTALYSVCIIFTRYIYF